MERDRESGKTARVDRSGRVVNLKDRAVSKKDRAIDRIEEIVETVVRVEIRLVGSATIILNRGGRKIGVRRERIASEGPTNTVAMLVQTISRAIVQAETGVESIVPAARGVRTRIVRSNLRDRMRSVPKSAGRSSQSTPEKREALNLPRVMLWGVGSSVGS